MIRRLALVAVVLAAFASVAANCNGGRDLSVTPTSTDVPGCTSTPNLKCVFEHLAPGDILTVHGGFYTQAVKTGVLPAGTSTQPIIVQNAPGEFPVIVGKLWLAYPTWWTVTGINVTWDTSASPTSESGKDEHMVNVYGGHDWTLANGELWNAHSFAALLVGDGNQNNLGAATVQGMCIHDTATTHSFPQDHGIYVDDLQASPDPHLAITRNIIYNTPNGRGIKLGSPTTSGGADNVVVSWNTIVNSGEHNVGVSDDTSNVWITKNILYNAGTHGEGYHVGTFTLSGTNDVASNNLGYLDVSGYLAPGITNGGGNITRNPQFGDLGCTGFHPQDTTAQSYGRWAG